MGGWKIELTRMSLYIAFPVTCFYLLNKPELFKDLLVKDRATYYPPEDAEAVKFL